MAPPGAALLPGGLPGPVATLLVALDAAAAAESRGQGAGTREKPWGNGENPWEMCGKRWKHMEKMMDYNGNITD